MILVAMTNAGESEYAYEYAMRMLSPAQAKELLRLQKIYETVDVKRGGLYCLEFYDYEVTYSRELLYLNGDVEQEWSAVEVPKNTKEATAACHIMDEPNAMISPTFRVTNTGILWTAWPQRGGGREFETPEITWQQLQEVADGRNPFAKLRYEGDAD